MKKIFFLLVYCLAMSKGFSQSNLGNDLAIGFYKQDSLSLQLAQFDLKLFEFKWDDPCKRFGVAGSYAPDREFVAYNESLNPISRYGDFESESSLKMPGDINIFWIHGLNGSTESLRIPAQATQFGAGSDFPARKVTSHRGTPSSISHKVQLYSEDGGVTAAAGDLEYYFNAMLQPINRTAKDYIIAHSQGGIVAREWLRKMEKEPNAYQNFAHGLVTFGTPHAGAQVLNNTRPDMYDKVPGYMKEACLKLARAVIEPTINDNLFTRLLISDEMKNKLTGFGCDLVAKSIVPFALDNYYKQTTRDYFVGSPFLIGTGTSSGHVEGLSEYTLKVPVVQFYGEELQPVLWKFMSSTMGMGHDEMDNKTMVFGYDQDDQLEKKVGNMINEFDAKYYLEKENEKATKKTCALYLTEASICYLSGNYWGAGALAILAGVEYSKLEGIRGNQKAYDEAKVWLSNANQSYQSELIGAQVIPIGYHCEIVEELDCRDLRKNPVGSGVPPVKLKITSKFETEGASCRFRSISEAYSDYHFMGHDGMEWHGPCTGTQTFFTTWKNKYSYQPNDGVVLAESASAKIKVNTAVDPSCTHVIKVLPETNHDQMKNCQKTKFALLDLYDGKFGPLFSVGKR
ncbi:MAG: hypothetical protein CFE21_09755 [Bacteroidetes bacterium B1(2017)]|nr:MAG: hypothetical protein CFE21_09755 [Bacteroidetes bacterium B1(2017)]